jgi:hypothetical protein
MFNHLSTLVIITFVVSTSLLETLECSKIMNHIVKRQTNMCELIQ